MFNAEKVRILERRVKNLENKFFALERGLGITLYEFSRDASINVYGKLYELIADFGQNDCEVNHSDLAGLKGEIMAKIGDVHKYLKIEYQTQPGRVLVEKPKK